jgi:hypothetical protein
MNQINIFHRKHTDINLDGSEGVFVFYTVLEFKEDGVVVDERLLNSDYVKTFEDHIRNFNIENVDELFKELADYGDIKYVIEICKIGHYFVYGKRIDVSNQHILNVLSNCFGINNENARELLQLVIRDVYSKIVTISSDSLLVKEIITSIFTSAIVKNELTAADLYTSITEAIESFEAKEISNIGGGA